MIRVNLLPRSREYVTIFGLKLDVDYVRHSCAGVVFVAIAALGAFGAESLRISRVEAAATSAEAQLAANAPRRAEAQLVAFDLARLEAEARRAAELHRSGYDVASAVARLGDAIPARVYLDDLTSDRGAIRLRGESGSLERIGETITSLGHAFPHLHASLGDVADRDSGSSAALTFTAAVEPPAPAPSNVPRLSALPDPAR